MRVRRQRVRLAMVLPCLAVVAACGTYHLPAQSTPTVTANPVCGPAGEWTESALAEALLPADAIPSPFATTASGPQSTPSPGSGAGPFAALRSASLDDRRDWQAGTSGIAFVELWAFPTDEAAASAAEQVTSALDGTGVSGTSAQVPGGTDYVTKGKGGQAYAVIAVRNKVVMEVSLGGATATQSTAESLAAQQYDRLCTHP